MPPMLKNVIEKALEAEMDGHLDEGERAKGNKRNGKGKKTLKSGFGTFDIDTPQDRQSSFEPELVKKRQTILADNLSDKIIGLYGLGMSYRDISAHRKEMYDTDISHTVLSQITDRIIPDVKAWQNRPLEPLYCIVWLDAMHYKVKVDGKIEHKALYNILGINKEGYKEVLGMYISESEGANFWLQVLTDLNNRDPYRLYRQPEGLYRGYPEHIPKDPGAEVHRPPDTEFPQVYRLKGPKGVSSGPQTGVPCHQ